MKTAGFILLGSLLTVGVQILIQSDYSLINKAEAAGNPCITAGAHNLDVLDNMINRHYRQGYRVKGGGGTGGDSGWKYIAIMCR